jgi:lipopolysaccharide export system protein LptC
MTTRHGDAAQRLATYQGLMLRNRIVSILRIGVPLLGALLLVVLIGQIYISSLGSRFGVGQITVTPDSVMVEAPEYTGLLDDGTAYQVAASGAQAATEAIDKVRLSEATLTMTRPDGLVTTVDARAATLDTTRQLVLVEQDAQVGNSEGTTGVIANSVFDYATQTLVGHGPVSISYADGTHLVAEGLTYNAVTLVWTFTRATVTLPDTPGARKTEMQTP